MSARINTTSRSFARTVSALMAFGFLFAVGAPARGQSPATDRARIEYAASADAAHEAIRRSLQEKRVLEKLQTALSPIRLPRPLLLKTAGCDGEINAWYENDAVTICYEYLAYVLETARRRDRPAWVSENAAVVGPVFDVMLHEVGHALFDYLAIPIFGREEDAADQFAALSLLELGKAEARDMMAGIAWLYLREDGVRRYKGLDRRRLRFVAPSAAADTHSTPLQRMYNTVCLAFGAAPDVFGQLKDRVSLPADRAEDCAGEFRQVAHAWRTLIRPHMDDARAKQVFGADWPGMLR